MPTMRRTGFVDKDGKTTDLANEGRDDAQYAKVCATIIENCYPEELRNVASDTSDRGRIHQWFKNHTKLGDNQATKFTAFYIMLLEADLSKEIPANTTNGKTAAKNSTRASAPRKESSAPPPVPPTENPKEETAVGGNSNVARDTNTRPKFVPELHIDVQVHISPESSPEQIEQIFASMAKHLKDMM
jgi:hypothetical protein